MRILLRATPSEDLCGEFSTLAEGFLAAGPQAELRRLTRHSPAARARARRSGSSRTDGAGAFSDPGLIVQDAGGQRWLPREHLADYLRALLADDAERRLLLSQPLEAAADAG